LKVTILGNGPSLKDIPLPTYWTVGVNKSYLKYWSPWAASLDFVAIFEMVVNAHPATYVFPFSRTPIMVMQSNMDFAEPPSFIRPIFSGPYAYWYTLTNLTFFNEIYLLGFDLDADLGHFYPTNKPLDDYSLHKVALGKILAAYGRTTKTNIWYVDRWMPLEKRLEL